MTTKDFLRADDGEPPKVLEGGIVIWPADFTEQEMLFWRKQHNLLPFGQTAPDVCPRCQGQEMVCEEHQTEPWEPEHCEHAPGAPCPVSSEWAYAYGRSHIIDVGDWDAEWDRLRRGEPTKGDLEEDKADGGNDQQKDNQDA